MLKSAILAHSTYINQLMMPTDSDYPMSFVSSINSNILFIGNFFTFWSLKNWALRYLNLMFHLHRKLCKYGFPLNLSCGNYYVGIDKLNIFLTVCLFLEIYWFCQLKDDPWTCGTVTVQENRISPELNVLSFKPVL